MRFSIKILLPAVLCMTAISSPALAGLFVFEDLSANNSGQGSFGGDKLDSVSGSYNDITEQFTWDVEFNSNPTPVDGFWLVVNNGPNPKQSNVNELAIMYGDMDTNTLTTYVYNGQNSASSWNNPGIHLQTDTFTSDSDSLSIDINATAINDWSTNPLYTGISFDDNIGIWFHISTGSNFVYDGNEIDQYNFSSQGWYDKANLTTTSVPEPFSFSLLLLGVIGLFASRRKRGL